jgi:hypothetical protein
MFKFLFSKGVLTQICASRYVRKINRISNEECIDNSQIEANQWSCNERFQCRNGQCVPLSYKYDGD